MCILYAVEHDDKIVFLHAVKEGPANQSYGLQVAQLAGIPKSVIEMAKSKLMELEQQAVSSSQIVNSEPKQMDFFTPTMSSRALTLLESLNPDELNPKEALACLYRLKELSMRF